VFSYSKRIRKLRSDNWVVCSESCNECARCWRLYRNNNWSHTREC